MTSPSTEADKSKLFDSHLTVIPNTNSGSSLQQHGNEVIEKESVASQNLVSNEEVEVLDSETEEVNTPKNKQNLPGSVENSGRKSDDDRIDDAPPLPEEDIPPLPQEIPPVADDGWAPVWEETAQAFYFYNRFTGATQWTNPRVPEASQVVENAPDGTSAALISGALSEETNVRSGAAGGYDPSIHGDYDPTAWYAQPVAPDSTETTLLSSNPTDAYAATGAFNRFTGRWQAADLTPENHNDENKSKRQMNAFFDVDAAANNHDGRSLKAERSGKKLSKTELKQFKEKRKAKKEEKRRAWLRD